MDTTPNEPPKPVIATEPSIRWLRKGWLAGLLAAGCPGLGHLYAGRALPALAIVLAPQLLFLMAVGIASLVETAFVPMLLVIVALNTGIYVAQIVSAVLVARGASPAYSLKRSNHVVAYIGFALFASFLSSLLGGAAKQFGIEVFKVPTATMTPSILIGDHVLVGKVGARNRTPRRGDVVLFRAPSRDTNYIKRVVGIAGDEISVIGGVLHLNGRSVSRKPLGPQRFSDRAGEGAWVPIELRVYEETLDDKRYLTAEQVEGWALPDFGPSRVPADSFFVLGDSRDNSMDSRAFGAVPRRNLLGRARGLFFSFGKDGPRLDRIGLRL